MDSIRISYNGEKDPMATIPPVTIQFENTVEDHVHAAQIVYRTTFFYRGDKVVAILLLLFGIYATITIGVEWWTVIFIVLAPIEWFNLLSAHTLKAKFAFKSNPKYREPYEVSFTEADIHFKTPTIDSTIDWKMYTSMLEDKQMFLMIYGRGMYSVIPKRAFANDADLDRFRELAGLHSL